MRRSVKNSQDLDFITTALTTYFVLYSRNIVWEGPSHLPAITVYRARIVSNLQAYYAIDTIIYLRLSHIPLL